VITLREGLGLSLAVVAALAFISYLLTMRAHEFGHPAALIRQRLIVLWCACAAILGLGWYLRSLFPLGLFNVNLHASAPGEPWIFLAGEGAALYLVLGLAGMGICAGVAFWAVSGLQHPAPGQAGDQK